MFAQYPLYSASIALYGGTAVGYELDESADWGLPVRARHGLMGAAQCSVARMWPPQVEKLKSELHNARAKGLKEWRIILKYPVRVALNPLVSTMGYLLPALMSGSIVVSIVLSLPTEGPLLYAALLGEDFFVSATILFILGALTVIGTLLSDIALAALDPRIRYVGSR